MFYVDGIMYTYHYPNAAVAIPLLIKYGKFRTLWSLLGIIIAAPTTKASAVTGKCGRRRDKHQTRI